MLFLFEQLWLCVTSKIQKAWVCLRNPYRELLLCEIYIVSDGHF